MTEQELSFEEAMARLEKIVAALEAGDLPLERSLALYEEGVGLMKRCASLLDTAEQTVTRLQVTETGEVTQVPFQPEEE